MGAVEAEFFDKVFCARHPQFSQLTKKRTHMGVVEAEFFDKAKRFSSFQLIQTQPLDLLTDFYTRPSYGFLH